MDALHTPSIEIDLLGQPRWRFAGGRNDLLNAQDAALFALLFIEGPQGRDVLAGQIWPTATQRQAANNLRKHVSRLRKDTGHALFDTGSTISLKTGVVADVVSLGSLPADRLLDAEFLAGCDYAENDFLHTWITEQRTGLRAQRADVLAGHAELLEQRNELAAAIRLSEGIVALAPQQEHAWRRLMRLHYLRGDHTAAIDAFERFERILRDQTGARPGPETLRLLNTVERGSQTQALPLKVVPVSLVRPPVRIGRDAEWQAMGRAWSAGRAYLLLGEAGIGKSRLMHDFSQSLKGVVAERARAGDVQAPYEVLARLLRGVLALQVPAPVGTARAELARLLPELGPAPQVPANESILRRAAETFLANASEQGLTALLVDDLHFADLASLETLRWLSASAALEMLRFGFAARPLDDGATGAFLRSWLDDSHRPERIGLTPLGRAEISELLAALDLPEFAGPELGARLHAHAGGHPLFTLETLKDAWLHRRDLRVDTLPAPQTVQTLIERRLRELPSEAIDLLRVAAVSGADLTAERAAALLGVTTLELTDAWALLEKANVLQDLRFAHDLMHESALALVPHPLRRALHSLVAELLACDPKVPPGRVADHWQSAERWAEAGACWQRAGIAARLAGRLEEQQGLLERAAACHRHAGDDAAEFEAVRATFDSLLLRHGGGGVLAALPRLEALAKTPMAVLQCRLVQAEALLDLERSAEALEVANAAVQMTPPFPQLIGDALCLQGMALAQVGRGEEAITVGQHAADAAHAVGLRAQELRSLRSLAYSLYKVGRLAASLPVQHRALELAMELGDAAETAAGEASVAALLAAVGDVPGSLERARRAHVRCCQLGLAQNSTVGAVNLTVLGRAAAYAGRFDEALEALQQAESMAGDSAAVGARAKSRIALSGLMLTLGASDPARALVSSLPAGTPPGMRMQAALVLARAEQMEGGSGGEHLARLGRLGAEHPDLPVVMSAWIEWSYQGCAADVVATLQRVSAQFEQLGRSGTARTLGIREVDRLGELNSGAAQARAGLLARALLPHIGTGTCAASYPPEGWLVLARAFERGGHVDTATQCRNRAVEWIRERALPHVPPAWRETFLHRNPVNALLLGAAG